MTTQQSLTKNEVKAHQSGRNAVIDVAKGIGMLFVIYAHVNYTPSLLTWIYAFHMPLFFIISGMLFSRERYASFGVFFKRKLCTLICPYVFFYLASMLIRFPLSVVTTGEVGETVRQYLMYFVNMFAAPDSSSVVNAPLWFVPCLFAAEIIYYFISGMKKQFIIIICTLLTVAGWLLECPALRPEGLIIPWSIDSALFAIGFFALGNLFSSGIKTTLARLSDSKNSFIISACAAVVFMAVLIPIAFLNGKISIGSKLLNNGFLLYLGGIVGTAGIFCASSALRKSKALVFLGRNSFTLMSTHYVIRIVLRLALSFAGMSYDPESISETVIPFIVVLLLSIVCTVIYNKLKSIVFKEKKAI